MDDGINYKLVCRTCLASDAEFYKLEAKVFVEDDEKVSFQECLKYCTKLEDVAEFPIYICTECSTALQVAYNFIKNALEAHEILRKKLGMHQPPSPIGTRANGQLCISNFTKERSQCERKVSFRCKICDQRVETKKSLKEHVKLHLDVISYNCELCQFNSKKRGALSDHYLFVHDLQATREQLKPRTITNQTATKTPLNSAIAENIQKDITNYAISQTETLTEPISVTQFLAPTEMQQIPGPQLITTSGFENLGNDLSLGNEFTIGNEYVVMQDGTVEEVMGNGVVIKYINTSDNAVTLDNGIFINNIMIQPSDGLINMTDGVNMANGTVANCGLINMPQDDITMGVYENPVNLDIDDIIVEENVEQETPEVVTNITAATVTSVTEDVSMRQLRCKMCKSTFPNQEDLKEHMLSHNEIPHFFCDNCDFYTFFKIDLTQHYKTKHFMQPTTKQLQPKNKVNFNVPKGAKNVYVCDSCIYDTPVKTILRRHYLSKHQIEATEAQLRPIKVTPPENCTDQDKSTEPKTRRTIKVKRDFPNGYSCPQCRRVFFWDSKLKEHYKQLCTKPIIAETFPIIENSATTYPNDVDVESIITGTELRTATAAILNHMNENNEGRVPADAIPQVVETDTIVDSIMEYDFNGDTIFEDDDEEEDDEDLKDLVLTTDDEQEYIRDCGSSTGVAFCVQCNKNFSTNYQFENHMFVHRGLAPYRCEMCTNLYNTKRDLIRHYQAVHKIIPTRDMIQAKGEKAIDVTVDQVPTILRSNAVSYMCAKCPFEIADIDNLRTHLGLMHGVADDNYMLQKLPFECPRCIRTFDSNLRLNLHIERNHSSLSVCHVKKEIGESITCKRCGLLLLPTELKSHEALCNRATEFECLSCSLVFDSRTKLVAHKNLQHNSDDSTKITNTGNLICQYCNSKYKTEEMLKQHLQRHTARNLQCGECQKTFVTKDELEEHKITHSNEYPHSCKDCDKKFRYTYHLNRHRDEVHSTRTYACIAKSCSLRFHSVKELKDHALTHGAIIIVHTCQYCFEEFETSEHLRVHAKNIHLVQLTEEELDECRAEKTENKTSK